MKIISFSINHKKAKIDFREKVSFTKSGLIKALEILREGTDFEEGVIISTCNRTELIAVVDTLTNAESRCRKFFSEFFRLQHGEILGQYDFKADTDAIYYLYEVAAGLDSIVLGEDQILGQVKEAYDKARENGASGKVLNKLFLGAITTAKEIRTTTRISENPLSISSIGIQKGKEVLGSLKDKTVLVVGYGKMSRLAMNHLLEEGVEKIYLCNRRAEKIQEVKDPKIQKISYEDKYRILREEEIHLVISATGAPHMIFERENFEGLHKGSSTGNQSLVMIDIALPRDVDPSIGDLPGIHLYTVDDLKEIAAKNMKGREALIEEIKESIEKAVADYEGWRRCIPVHPKIAKIKNQSNTLVDRELEDLFRKLEHLEGKDQKLIEKKVKSIVKKILKTPILEMKKAGENGESDEAVKFAHRYLGI